MEAIIVQFLDEQARILQERVSRLQHANSGLENRIETVLRLADAETQRAEAAERAMRDMRRELDAIRLRLREAKKLHP